MIRTKFEHLSVEKNGRFLGKVYLGFVDEFFCTGLGKNLALKILNLGVVKTEVLRTLFNDLVIRYSHISWQP